MNLKIKATPQKIYHSSLVLILILNLVSLFFVYQFIYDNVYKTMFMSRDELLQQSIIKVEDIDLEKFDKVVGKIKARQAKSDIKVNRDIFY